ncbi:hypothetical protein [Chitinophaga tropicalis]|uniref:UspA domain-containing protein n=1 Tax=Chitinophaga tropicalis TaxID=2683588 RepID=A0A7K1U2Z7_9BACT|nr:hypothetical protein [Chitinophaga tropicalis]MVT08729.1 hypothetical protein [Chitinophaga tropicalis]
MKKIIAAFDSLRFSESTLAYSIMLARQLNVHLVAVFMNDITYSSYNRYKVLAESGDDAYREIEKLDEEDAKCRKASRCL